MGYAQRRGLKPLSDAALTRVYWHGQLSMINPIVFVLS